MFGKKTIKEILEYANQINGRVRELEEKVKVSDLNKKIEEYGLSVHKDFDMYYVKCFICDEIKTAHYSLADIKIRLDGYIAGYEDIDINVECECDFDEACSDCTVDLPEPKVEVMNTKKPLNSNKKK